MCISERDVHMAIYRHSADSGVPVFFRRPAKRFRSAILEAHAAVSIARVLQLQRSVRSKSVSHIHMGAMMSQSKWSKVMLLDCGPRRMKARILTLPLAALLASHAQAQAQQPMDAAALFGKGTPIGHDGEFATPIGYALFADGSLAVADYGRFDVTRLSPDGKVLWRSGRKGGGPGEFQLPVRSMVLDDQSVYVLDAGKGGVVTHLGPDGKYMGEVTGDIRLRTEAMLLLPTGHIAILGPTDDPRGRGAAIHIFTTRLQHVRSFGRLPEMKDPRVLTSFGVGGLTLTPDGQLLHTRFYPYEVSKYTIEGTELFRLRVPLAVTAPEEFVRIDVFEGRVTRIVTPHLLRPRPVHELGAGYFLGGRSAGKTNSLDVINRDGQIVSTFPFPDHWEGVVAIDRARRHFWFSGEENDVPVLWRVPFSAGVPPS